MWGIQPLQDYLSNLHIHKEREEQQGAAPVPRRHHELQGPIRQDARAWRSNLLRTETCFIFRD